MLKRLAIALSFSTFLTAAFVQPAQADPITATIAAISAFAASSAIAGAVVQIGIGIAVDVAANLIQNLIGKPATPSASVGVKLQLGQSGTDPQTFIMGNRATAGSLNYWGTWGSDGGTPNAYLTREIIISDVPIGHLTGGWVGDQRITLPDMTGSSPTPQGWPIPEFNSGGSDYMWWRYRDGTQTTADSFMRSTFGADPDRPYSSDMIGRGRACVTVTMRINPQLFPSSQPKIVFETDGIDLYNVAKDSTAGGSGSHRAGDPSTWEPSANLVVHVYNVLKGVFWGDEWMFGLQAMSLNRLPASSWIAAIAEAAASVPLAAGGTEPQFSGGLEIPVSSQADQVIAELLKGCSGRLAEIGGTYKPLVGAPPAAVYSFTDAGIIITRARGIDPFPTIDQTYNGAQGSYPEPSQGWVMKDAAAIYNAGLEAEDGGRRMAPDLQFNAVSSGTQVQRLLKSAVLDGRNFRRPNLVLPPIASELEPLDVVSWTSTAEGYSDKKFIIDSMDDEPTYLQAISLLETDPSDFDWDESTDEQPQTLGFLTTKRPTPQVTVGFSVIPATIVDQDGVTRKPAVTFAWDGAIDDVRAVGFQLRTAATSALIYSDSTDDVSAGAITVASAAILSAQDLQARAKYYPRSARVTYWSNQDVDGVEGAWLDVTTPDVPESDVTDIQVAQLGNELLAAYGLVVTDSGGASIAGQINLLIQQAAAQAAANLDAMALTRTVTNVLKVQTATAVAAVLTETLARIDGDSALAEQITEVLASVGDVIADGYLRFDAEVDGLTSTSTITAKVKATSGSSFSQAAWILKAQADGMGGSLGYFGVLGKLYVFADESSDPIEAISMDPTTGTITAADIQLASGNVVLNDTGITVTG